MSRLEMVFPSSEMDRLQGCIERLLPHLDPSGVALAGGVAIELALAAAGLRGRRETIADVDLVARGRDVISPSLAEEFLVCHYHTPQPGYPKFLVMVVDPVARLRIDIFPDLAGALGKARPFHLGEERLLMLDPASMLEHKLRTLSRAAAASPVDEKHFLDALALSEVCGSPAPHVPAECLVKEEYSSDQGARCPRCEASRDPAFPLAPKQDIFQLLGYV